MSGRAPAADSGSPAPRYSELVLATVVAAVVAMLIVPLPAALVDLLLALNMTVAVLLLAVAAHVSDPMRMAGFPAVLLLTTFFRLGLAITTTRLILAQADAGQVVGAFGGVVVAGSLVVGIGMLLAIVVVQLMVVARGAERVAEVAARFALDAMPGQQLAIDAEVRTGLISPAEARRRRRLLERESQLYGSMDGAMKLVKGDAVATVVITLINVAGGMVVGVGSRGMSAGEAASVYATLAIGNGLVVQIPALLVALAAGLIVIRVASPDGPDSSDSNAGGAPLGHGAPGQMLAQPRAMAVAAVIMLGLAVIPGLPTMPFLAVAVLSAVVAYVLRGHAATNAAAAGAAAGDDMVAPLVLELGGALAAEVGAGGGAFSARIAPGLQRRLRARLGLLAPPLMVRVDPGLGHGYRVLIFGLPVASATPEAMIDATPEAMIDAENRDLPMYARKAPASPPQLDDTTPAALLGSAIAAILDRDAAQLFSMQEVHAALEQLGRARPAVVREVVPGLIGLPALTTLLGRLARERIAIADLSAILHAVAETSGRGRMLDAATQAEHVRTALCAQISRQVAPHGTVRAWQLDPLVEDTLRSALLTDASGSYLALEPVLARELGDAIARAHAEARSDAPAVLLAGMDVRRHVRELVAGRLPRLMVLSPRELLPETAVHIVATVGL